MLILYFNKYNHILYSYCKVYKFFNKNFNNSYIYKFFFVILIKREIPCLDKDIISYSIFDNQIYIISYLITYSILC